MENCKFSRFHAIPKKKRKIFRRHFSLAHKFYSPFLPAFTFVIARRVGAGCLVFPIQDIFPKEELQRIRFFLSSDEREIERFEALLNGGSSFRSIVWSMLTVMSLRRARSVVFWYRDLQCQFKGHQGCAGNSNHHQTKHICSSPSLDIFDMILIV